MKIYSGKQEGKTLLLFFHFYLKMCLMCLITLECLFQSQDHMKLNSTTFFDVT